ncbi:MAG: type II toxin-antitoxin system RelE/ParE family toxin [Syntrophobacteraceae bacterium]|nr:type II toxin-antitoxin system RelE/ParE family toxin [Syntrophobacteraceae bacterium]
MDKFKIFETDQFIQDLSQDFKGQSERIANRLREYVYPQLRENPFFGKNIKKLKNYQPETWRYRIGSYRFFYKIDSKARIVYMLAVDSRKDSYR